MELVEDLGMLYSSEKASRTYRYGMFKCKCGELTKAQVASVKNGRIKQCKDCSTKERTTHGETSTTLYKRWKSMKKRCYNPNDKSYKDYGALGITVCDEWVNSYEAFRDWALANGYKENLQIDKDILCKKLNISPAVYSPDTCIFIHKDTNSRATRQIYKTNTSGYRGVTKYKDGIRYRAQIHDGKKKHIGLYETAIEAAKAYDSYIIEHGLDHTRNF